MFGRRGRFCGRGAEVAGVRMALSEPRPRLSVAVAEAPDRERSIHLQDVVDGADED